MPKVAFCVFTRGHDITAGLFYWIIGMLQKYQEIELYFFRDKFAASNTCVAIHKFVLARKDIEYVLMIDSDVIPTQDTLEKLLEAKKDIVSAPMWCYDRLRGNVHHSIHEKANVVRSNELLEERKGVVEVEQSSFGSILIHRRVFDHFPHRSMFVFFDELGLMPFPADVVFAQVVRDAGFKLYVNYDIKGLTHHANVVLTDLLLKDIRRVGMYDTRAYDKGHSEVGQTHYHWVKEGDEQT